MITYTIKVSWMLLIFQQEMDCMLSEHVMALHAGKKRWIIKLFCNYFMLMISRMFDWQNCLTTVLRFKSEKGRFVLHLLLQGVEERGQELWLSNGQVPKECQIHFLVKIQSSTVRKLWCKDVAIISITWSSLMHLFFQSPIGTGSGRDLNSTSPVLQSAAQILG